MKTTDNMVLFWGGPFSQWYAVGFVVEGRNYCTAEQFMMAMKARFFCDTEAEEKIMATKNAKEQKAIGRTVNNFDSERWNSVCRDVVFVGNMHKFSQSPGLKKILLETGNRELVEASPYDKIWGIGLAVEDDRCFDKTLWQGTNWLGEALMRVREELRK